MKRKFDLNLKRIYTRYFIISVIIPVIIIFLYFSILFNNQSRAYKSDVFSGVLNTSSNALLGSFSEIEQISFTPYLYKDIFYTMSYMAHGYYNPNAEYPDFIDIANFETDYTILFTKLIHSSKLKVMSVTFYPFGKELGTGYTISRNKGGMQFIECDLQYVNALYKYTVPYGSSPVFIVTHDDSTKKSTEPNFSLLRTIKDFDSGKEIGLLRIDTDLSSILPSVNGINTSKNSRILLVDSNHTIAYTSGEVAQELVDVALTGNSTIEVENAKYDLQHRYIGVTGWQLIYVGALKDSQLSNFYTFLIMFIATFSAFISAFIIYRIQSRKMVSSIESIMTTIKQFQKGNLSYQCTVKDEKEFSLIAEALNETGHKIEDLIKTHYEDRIEKSKAEYLALQSQINPHFLYNTLNGFIALNRCGEKKLLEDSIIQLAKLFRHICNNSDLTTVDAEFDFATRYLELQKLRFEERISYQIKMDYITKKMPIPRLIVQPIVENCIVHGMEESGQPIQITLHSYIKINNGQKILVLKITDNGIGFDTNISKNESQIGINNVIQRLSYFKSDSYYELTSTPNVGTSVSLFIPLSERGT